MSKVPAQTRQPRRVLMTADAVGGVWTYAVELIRGLAAHNYHVALAILGPKPTEGQLRECAELANCEVLHGGRALEWMDNPWREVDAAGEWLQEIAEEYAPDLVHLNDYSYVTLPWRCPVVLAAHSCVSTWWRSVKGEAVPARYAEYRRRVRAALLGATAVVTPTSAFRRQLAEEYAVSLSPETISNGRSAGAFVPGSKQACILSAGRLWDEGKNIQLLERIASYVKWPIAVAGEREMSGVQTATADQLLCLGRLNGRELANELSSASIYAAPARYEPFGLAILEAALSGCALVLSDLPSLRETWGDCAVFVPVDDDAAWIAALNELTANEAKLRDYQAQARSRAIAFTPERQAAAYASLYQSLLQIPRELPELLYA